MEKYQPNIVLKTRNLDIGYSNGKKQSVILSDINIEVARGQLICFMGPNGVGKSTLLRTLCKMQPALSGEVYFQEKELRQITANELAQKISLVLTDRINAGNMSGYDLVTMGRYPHTDWNIKLSKEDQEKIETSISATRIEGYVHKKIYELSDGQLQKVMIAKALCQDTPLMILDEPTAHLDLNNRVEIVNLLKELAQSTGKSILMATHELDLALQVADRLWLAGFNQPMVEGIPEDLVLNDTIDQVFQLKGFDLKTGNLEKKSLGYKIQLEGSGHEYLWTKNALERNGFEIDEKAEIKVRIFTENELYWQIEKKGVVVTNTLENLINNLKENF